MVYTEKGDVRQIEKFLHGERGKNENIKATDGVYFVMDSFQRNDACRPYIQGFLIDENGEKRRCECSMHNPLHDANITDRASREFRNGERKNKEHAKMRECVAGAILLVTPHEISENADGSYTLIADKMNTIFPAPLSASEASKPMYTPSSDQRSSQKNGVDKILRKEFHPRMSTKNSVAFEDSKVFTLSQSENNTARTAEDTNSVSIIIDSFHRDDAGRPYVKGFLINDDGQRHPCNCYMNEPSNDHKIADRASREFRNGVRKHPEDAKMVECGAGDILLVKLHEIKEHADGSYTLKADKLTTMVYDNPMGFIRNHTENSAVCTAKEYLASSSRQADHLKQRDDMLNKLLGTTPKTDVSTAPKMQ